MIDILTNADREARAADFDAMFRARAAVFHDRLGWAVCVRDGWESDRYDEDEDPVYLVSRNGEGCVTGSLRILPTTGETMLRNEFAGFFDEPVDVQTPIAWECTRFCVHPRNRPNDQSDLQVSSELLIGLCCLCLSSGIEQVMGLYDQAMTRIYRRIGWSPVPLARSKPEVGQLIVGIWDVSHEAIEAMTVRSVPDRPGFGLVEKRHALRASA
ncbi:MULTISPECIES: acyl-homoserine-lactone synthase [Methylobacterium]|uniref:acyl-homoserine-lactone synthase n=1 Tax=Methylobacterium TaxID=407 RepID=UPI0008E8CBEE|nr:MULTISPECIES: acyl-homoserine-lactone synthase [Methylobacterium]MBZ6414971.1 acyl-homoserine-lactone synthase [Methylobacterium sp.]MBK3400597.1 acyl-homoserine-lactone synthase [Methylobacterium ajmalii]MBK3408873.1 acyl-homoserine-lactone synthase [Methylobacterium ajmalii]MBK3422328.1 acyl-homoserine-lactone synthase [Methylobacterium ajmalii]SFF52012.1 N-acyl-L-homoserine lactone synthetase [Methylobacterium sp. yr596]